MVQWKSFWAFCIYFGFELFASSLVLCLYSQFLSRSFTAPISIKNYISGVKTLDVLLEVPVNAFQSYYLKLIIRGISRLKPHCPKRVEPVTPKILIRIWNLLDFINPVHVVFWSLFVMAFFTMSRKSNLVSSGMFDKSNQLYRKYVLLGSQGLMVNFKWSKTIQYGQRLLQIPLVAAPGNCLCPVAIYKAMLQAVPAPKSSPAFVIQTKSRLQTVSYQMFHKFLRSCIAEKILVHTVLGGVERVVTSSSSGRID